MDSMKWIISANGRPALGGSCERRPAAEIDLNLVLLRDLVNVHLHSRSHGTSLPLISAA